MPAFIHAFTPVWSFIHPLMPAFIYSLMLLFVIHPFTHACIQSCLHLFIHAHSFIHSLMPVFVIHSFTHVVTHAVIHSCTVIHSCLHPFLRAWSFTHLCLCLLFIHSQMPALIHSSLVIHSPCLCSLLFIHKCLCLFLHSHMTVFIHSFKHGHSFTLPVFIIHPFINACIHSFIYSSLLHCTLDSTGARALPPVITEPALLGPWRVPPEF